ncbi:hypothetical protein BaRGS_00011330 [Batillaria attramentaria]|uniref:Ig-like domain-containing protein n=1 Tax=Batillaria attramentaria TaxID=370345 RepID=A0ABD0LE52_9CAEN
MNGEFHGNDSNTLTLNESDHVTVTLLCSAYGRPAPRVYLIKNGTEEIASNGVPDKHDFTQAVPYTLGPAECEHTGNYTCSFKDGALNLDNRILKLGVNCAPRKPKNISDIDTCPSAINKDGFVLLVVANPPPSPDDVTVTYVGDTKDGNNSALFTVLVHNISSFETKLNVSAKDYEKLQDGQYKLSVSNAFGNLYCTFHRDGDDGAVLASTTNIIIAVVVGVLIILAAIIIFFVIRRRREYTNQAFSQNGSDADHDSGIGMNGRSSPPDKNPDSNQAPRYSDGAGYASFNEFTPTKQQEGVLRKKSARTAAYEVTSITGGQVSIKQAAPQPNAYQEPWDTKNKEMTLAGAPGGPPTLHNVGPKGDEYAMVSNANNKTTITVGPKGDEYSTVAKHGKGDNTQGSPAKAQGPEDAAASRGPPLSMTPHPLDTPGYATLAQMAPDQGNQGDVTSSSGDAAASGSPVKNTSSSGDGTDFYDHVQRDGHDPKSTSQGPGVQYSHIGNY